MKDLTFLCRLSQSYRKGGREEGEGREEERKGGKRGKGGKGGREEGRKGGRRGRGGKEGREEGRKRTECTFSNCL